MDSLLVVNQVKGEYEAHDEQMIKYQELVAEMCTNFDEVLIEQIPREHNSQADALSKLASSEGAADFSNIQVTKFAKPAIERDLVTTVAVFEETWMTPIIDYLKNGMVPEDRVKDRLLQLWATR